MHDGVYGWSLKSRVISWRLYPYIYYGEGIERMNTEKKADRVYDELWQTFVACCLLVMFRYNRKLWTRCSGPFEDSAVPFEVLTGTPPTRRGGISSNWVSLIGLAMQ